MRRPVLPAAGALAVGILIGYYEREGFFAVWLPQTCVRIGGILLLCAACLLLIALRGERHFSGGVSVILVIFLLTGILVASWGESRFAKQEEWAGTTRTFQGRILSVRSTDTGDRAVVEDEKNGGRVMVSVYQPKRIPTELAGARVRFRGEVSLPAKRRNPAGFDYRLYLKTQKVGCLVTADSNGLCRLPGPAEPLLSVAAALRERMEKLLSRTMEDESRGLFFAMLFGEKSMLPDELADSFRRNGIAHIMAVSGLHVGLVYGLLAGTVCRRKGKGAALVISGALIFYGALSDFSPSAVRAILMILLHLFSQVTHRRYDMSCAAATAAILMLGNNPFLLFHSGFQLSFLAVFALSILGPRGERALDHMRQRSAGKSWRKPLLLGAGGLIPLLMLQAAMAPAVSWLFNSWSWAVFLLNAPVLFLAGLLIPLGVVLLCFCGVELAVEFLAGIELYGWGAVEGVTAKAAELLLQVMKFLNQALYLPGITSKWVVSPRPWALALFLALLFFLSSESFQILCRRGKTRTVFSAVAFLTAAAVFTGACAPSVLRTGSMGHWPGLVFVDVGQGDCLHIRTPSGKNVLIDGGGSVSYPVGRKILLPYLLKNGVNRIDLAIATHLHEDHFQGIAELAQEIPVEKLGVYEANRLREAELTKRTGLNGEQLIYLSAGQTIRVDEQVEIQVLLPAADTEAAYGEMVAADADENRSSLLLRVNYGELSVLMTGDLGFPGEEEAMRRYPDPLLKADILKVGHHGSRSSTGDSFLQSVSPKLAVIQVGKNNFGHPSRDVIEKCRQYDIMIERNDLGGAVTLTRSKEGGWRIETVIPSQLH